MKSNVMGARASALGAGMLFGVGLAIAGMTKPSKVVGFLDLFDVKFHLPTRKDIDRRLVLGAAVFGVGWGLGGFCPGPGIVSAGSGSLGALVFVVGMTIGMLIESAVARSMAGRAADDVGGSTTT